MHKLTSAEAARRRCDSCDVFIYIENEAYIFLFNPETNRNRDNNFKVF